MLRSRLIVNSPGNHVVSPEAENGKAAVGRICKKVRF